MTTTNTIQPETIADILDNKISVPTLADITKTFVDNVDDDFEFGGNSYKNELLGVALNIINSFDEKPFCLKDFVLLSSFLDLPTNKCAEFFFAWIKALEETNRVIITKPENSCYEWESYQFCGGK